MRFEDGLCHLLPTAPGSGGASDTGTAAGPHEPARPDTAVDTDSDTGASVGDALLFGDPIRTLGSDYEGSGAGDLPLNEWLSAAVIDQSVAIVVGHEGYGIVSFEDGTKLHQEDLQRVYRVASDGMHAVLATRVNGLMLVDVSQGADTRGVTDLGSGMTAGRLHEDVAIEGERILLGGRSQGGVMLDLTGSLVGILPADDAFGVGLQGDRAVVTDDATLLLFDISDPESPVELARATMTGEGRDVAWEADRLVVGMGGAGVSVWSTAGDALRHRGDLVIPGAALSVAVDGQYAWVAGWSLVALVDLSNDVPRVLGHEPSRFTGHGVAAAGGRAIVADWFTSTAMQVVEGVAGPELDLPARVYLKPDVSGGNDTATVTNYGPLELEMSLTPDTNVVLSSENLLVPAYSSLGLRIELLGDTATGGGVAWTSNDPDESSGRIEIEQADQGIGSSHVDFTLPGIEMPSGDEGRWTLSDHQGSAVVLVYWSLL